MAALAAEQHDAQQKEQDSEGAAEAGADVEV
jgi:hypothetical protein